MGWTELLVAVISLTTLEVVLGKKADIVQKPEQSGDVPITYASIDKARQLLGYEPRTGLKEGILQFKDWLLKQ